MSYMLTCIEDEDSFFTEIAMFSRMNDSDNNFDITKKLSLSLSL